MEYDHRDFPADFPLLHSTTHSDELYPRETLVQGEFRAFMHFHSSTEIGYCRSGKGTLRVENKSVTYSSGDVIIIPPLAVHIVYRDRFTQTQPMDMDWLNVDLPALFYKENPSLLSRFNQNTPHFPNVISCGSNLLIGTIIREVCDTIQSGEPKYRNEKVYGLMLAFLAEAARLIPESPANVTPANDSFISSLAPCITWLNDNYSKSATPEEMAKLCHMSATNFRRTFKKHMGMTPLDYINYIRVQKAKELLSATDMSILNVCLAVGFESTSTFNRWFKEITDSTPRNWRSSVHPPLT